MYDEEEEYHPVEETIDYFDDTFDEGVNDFFDVENANQEIQEWAVDALEDDLGVEDDEDEGEDEGEDDEYEYEDEGEDEYEYEDDVEEFGAPPTAAERQAARTARQAAFMDPAAQAARAASGAEGMKAFQAGAGIFQSLAPLLGQGIQQARADQAAKRARADRRREERRARKERRKTPRRPPPRRGPPPPPPQQQQRQMFMQRPPPGPPLSAGIPAGGLPALRDKDKKLALWIAGGTVGLVAIIGGVYLIVKK